VISLGLAVHAGLGEHRAGLLIGCREQMHSLPVGTGMPGAPHRLAIHGQCPPRSPAVPGLLMPSPQPPGKPRPDRSIECVSVNGFQDPADSGLIRRLEPAGQRITPDPQQGQDLRRRIRHPFTDRHKRPRPRQHRRHRCQ